MTRTIQAAVHTRTGEISVRAPDGAAEVRTADLIWTTGARVLRYDWFDGPYWEELSLDPAHVRMGRLQSGAPLLADHRSELRSVIGVVESAALAESQGSATVRFVKEGVDPEADKIVAKISDRILRNVSVGYRTYQTERVLPDVDEVPVYRAIDWEPVEISIVSMGADAGAGVRGEQHQQTNACVVHDHREGILPEKKSDTPVAAPPPPVDEAKIRSEAVQAERVRAAEIRQAAKALHVVERGEQLVADGVSVDEARKALIDEAARSDTADRQAPNGASDVQVTRAEEDKHREAHVAALLERAGKIDQVHRALEKKDLPSGLRRGLAIVDPSNEFRGLSLMDLVRRSLEKVGVRTAGKSKLEVARLVLRGGGYAATGDFPILLEDVARKTLLSAYATQPDSWRTFVGVEFVSDFRAASRYRAGSFGDVLEVVPEGKDYPQVAVPDGAKVSIYTETKAAIIALTRQMIVNDDLGAFTAIAQQFGRAAGLGQEKAAYALLTANSGLGPTMADTNPFFHSTRGNVNSTGSALSVAGLDADRVVMASQTDVSANEYLDLRPEVLVVPIGLESSARVINAATFDHDSTKLQKPNPVQGLFRTITGSPRLTGTRRYLFAPVSQVPAFVCAFLDESGQGPVLDSEYEFSSEAVKYSVRIDYRMQAFDPKGAVTNAGA